MVLRSPCEAMEALIRRIKSALSENLKVISRPPHKKFVGEYQVSSSRDGKNPYKVTLISSKGIDGSCDCHDFQRNTLRFCKHLSCVYLYLAARPRLQKKFLRETKKLEPIFRFTPPIQYEKEINYLEGIYFIGKNHQVSPHALKKIKNLFVWNSSGNHPFQQKKQSLALIQHLTELEKIPKSL